MTALKAHEVERYLGSPDLEAGVYLAYGTDAGLVREVGERLITHFAGSPPDPMAHVSLFGADLNTDPGHLVDEARAPSLFGGRRTIRVRGATKALAPVLKQLLDDVPDCVIVLEAGNLARDDGLRKLGEASRYARVLPCYADNDRAIASLIEATFRKASIEASPAAVTLLQGLLGNDREVTRRELEKLCLFAAKTRRIEAEDVEILIGDNSARAIDAVLDATGGGDAAALDVALTSAVISGIDPQRLLGAALNHFLQLRRLRALVDKGESPKNAVGSLRPRIHFSRAPSLEQQLRVWSEPSLARAAARLYEAIHETRRNASIRHALTNRALLAVCQAGARR